MALQTKEFDRSVIGMFVVTWLRLRVCRVMKNARDTTKHDCLDTSQPIVTSQDLKGLIWFVHPICKAFHCRRHETSSSQDRLCQITDVIIHQQTRENGMTFLIVISHYSVVIKPKNKMTTTVMRQDGSVFDAGMYSLGVLRVSLVL